MAQQKGVVLYCKGREPTEIEIPQPRGTPGGLHPPDYGKYLPNADREHLLAGDCPFSHLSGNAVVVIYDANSSDPENLSASRLTTNVTTGDQIPIKGDALVLYSKPGCNFGTKEWEELDNVIYDELLEFFGQGLKPRAEDLRRLVNDFNDGKFRYKIDKGPWGSAEDLNKDDGGEQELPGWG